MAKSLSQQLNDRKAMDQMLSEANKEITGDGSLFDSIRKCNLDGEPLDDVPPNGNPEDKEK